MRIPLHGSRFVAPLVGSLLAVLLISPQVVLAEEPEPSGEVTIEGSDAGIVEELRVNGQLYAIRVSPKRGLPYYLVDSDGDGNLETRKNDTDSDLLIPAWVIKQW